MAETEAKGPSQCKLHVGTWGSEKGEVFYGYRSKRFGGDRCRKSYQEFLASDTILLSVSKKPGKI